MVPDYKSAVNDMAGSLISWRMWGRMGWQEIKRRYRRTTFGPFWTTMSLGVFIFTLGILWAQLWKQDPKTYLPFLTSGMLVWTLVSTNIIEGCGTFTAGESIIKSMPFSYTILACTIVWRNLVVFAHNLLIFIAVGLYARVPLTMETLLIFPGLLLIALNSVWICVVLGALCARFRDISQVVTSILQVSMFITPIFWAPNQVDARFAKFVNFNVLYHYVDIVRSPLLGKAPESWSYIVTLIATVLGWTLAIMLFSRFRRRIPYWL